MLPDDSLRDGMSAAWLPTSTMLPANPGAAGAAGVFKKLHKICDRVKFVRGIDHELG